ncbi:MAG: DoxX family protein [Dokdonella sp.]
MRYAMFEQQRNVLILLARILMMLLFVIFGAEKLIGFAGTVAYMTSLGLPLPTVSAAVVVIMELFVGIALAIGFYTRPLALLLALYTLGTALIGHHYWTLSGDAHAENMVSFYKNISIIGGLLLLCVVGPGKYSIDKR